MPIPDYQTLMLPVLVASSKGEVRISPALRTSGGKRQRRAHRLRACFCCGY
jgi:hypothetical protein